MTDVVGPAGNPVDRRRATFVLADISGYTRFLEAVSGAHGAALERGETPPAYPLMTTLLDAIVGSLVPPFTLAKLEGDAVFAYRDDDGRVLSAGEVLACVRGCYAAFRDQILRTEAALTCTCAACVSIGALELKFVLHHGTYVAQTIAGSVELLGPDVTLAHRLLKNDVVARTGWRAYALFTSVAVRHLALDDPDARELGLEYEHAGRLEATVLPLVRGR